MDAPQRRPPRRGLASHVALLAPFAARSGGGGSEGTRVGNGLVAVPVVAIDGTDGETSTS